MEQKTSAQLVLISGIIILVLSGLNVISWIISYTVFKSLQTLPTFLIPFLEAFMDYLKHPFQFVSIFVMIVIGIFLIIASKKMKIPEKLHHWSVLSLVIGLIIIFELHGGNIFGGVSAGILSILGGALGLYCSINKRK